ncbi:Zn(2)-C6 fungal-type domain-containing protein [Mycena indigotica]|uniref:Zn(2)-C6 fungal-type domain-containing protein n=1 Tax=Mycena indigotica TaxID=2126181 RepID=A0A8H6WAM5_9AGAR|nr:Zn(2)-C6 fungal-type domain-containing protein [Mycena indigotica]KAF7309301.1 Zn(2)-C6 fungal-type domain-containing protein [Mycena indigotica]
MEAPPEEPRFPPELEREILEFAARICPESIPNLLCVARRVLLWIEPLVYHTLEIDSSKRFKAFLAATKSRPPDFFARHVHRLIIHISYDRDSPLDDAWAALALCTGVTRVAGVGAIVNPPLAWVLAGMRLERVALYLSHVFPGSVELDSQCFQTLTHLDLFDDLWNNEVAMEYAAKLARLPALTHLALNGTVDWDVTENLLQNCESLRILVVLWSLSASEGQTRAKEVPFRDDRFLMSKYTNMTAGVQDPPSLWSQAEEFIRRKREKRLDAALFWMGGVTLD